MKAGPNGARQALEDFWEAVSQEAVKSPAQRSPIAVLTGDRGLDTSPGYIWFDALTPLVSPYRQELDARHTIHYRLSAILGCKGMDRNTLRPDR